MQFSNIADPISLTLAGMIMLSKPELQNAYSSIFVTVSGIIILVNLVQLINALPPILSTLPRIVTRVKFSHSSNKLLLIVVTPSGIIMFVKPEPEKAAFPILITV
uniref:Uncharacterized protein n=1 Tax=viral metagenome TaxID=1070528 RepID=A0A6C0F5R9_9ZZZZ